MPSRPWSALRGALLSVLASAAAARGAAAQAGTLGAPVSVSLAAEKPATLSVSIVSGGSQSIASLVSGAVNNFPTPVQVQTSWDLRPNSGTLSLVAYVGNPAQALTGPASIPSSRLRARMTTGAVPTYTPIASNGVGGVGTAGGSLVLFTYAVCNSNACRQQTRTDPLDLQLDLSGLALPPGNYSGTLTLRAVTY
jgi:hypothetical protein